MNDITVISCGYMYFSPWMGSLTRSDEWRYDPQLEKSGTLWALFPFEKGLYLFARVIFHVTGWRPRAWG